MTKYGSASVILLSDHEVKVNLKVTDLVVYHAWMDVVDTWTNVRYWMKRIFCASPTPCSDAEDEWQARKNSYNGKAWIHVSFPVQWQILLYPCPAELRYALPLQTGLGGWYWMKRIFCASPTPCSDAEDEWQARKNSYNGKAWIHVSFPVQWQILLYPCPAELRYALPLQTGLGGSVGCAVRLETRKLLVQPPLRSVTFFLGDWSWNIFYGHCLPSADSRRALVSFWRNNMHNTG